MSQKKIIIGAIGDAFGIKGWSHLISFTDPRDNLFHYKNWQIQVDRKDENQFKPVKFEAYKPHADGFVIKMENSNDRDQALLLKGKVIAVDRSELPETKKDEYYWSDLIGLQVINTKNESLGFIDHLFETGSNDVIVTVIESPIGKHIAKKNIYIPYLKNVIKAVDLDKKTLLVEWDPEA